MLSKRNPELGVKLLLHTSTAADNIFNNSLDFDHENALRPVLGELLTQAFALHDEEITDNKVQRRCVVNMVGALLACESLSGRDYEHFITKTAQYAAKATKKQDQCEMVALCSHLFYNIGKEVSKLFSIRLKCCIDTDIPSHSLSKGKERIQKPTANSRMFATFLEARRRLRHF
jgi:hypothetical protein